MPRDARIQGIVNCAEQMLALTEEIRHSSLEKAAELRSSPETNPETIAFLEDFAERAEALAELIEEDIITAAIGLNNLAGPIQHLLSEAD